MKTDEKREEVKEKLGLGGLSAVFVFLFLGIVIGSFYFVKKNRKSEVVMPAGVNYVAPENKTGAVSKNTMSYDYSALVDSGADQWTTYKSKKFGYSFSYPKVLIPLILPNDPSDAVTFKVGDKPPELNLLINVEKISSYDKTLEGNQEKFVREYWRHFSGLKDLKEITKFTNDKGLSGFRVTYVTKSNTVTPGNYFFPMEGDNDHLIRMANIFGSEGQELYMKMLNSLDYKAK